MSIFQSLKASKFKALWILAAWIVAFTIWIVGFTDLTQDTKLDDDYYDSQLKNNNPKKSQDVKVINVFQHSGIKKVAQSLGYFDKRDKDVHSNVYDHIFSRHDFTSLLQLSFEERCDLYFKNLYLNDTNWFLNPHSDLSVENRNKFEFHNFRAKKLEGPKEEYVKNLKEKFEKEKENENKNDEESKEGEDGKEEAKEEGKEEGKERRDKEKLVDEDLENYFRRLNSKDELEVSVIPDDLVTTEELEAKIRKEYDEFWAKNAGKESTMVNYLSHFRIFNKCFLTNDMVEQKDQTDKSLSIEKSLNLPAKKFKYTPEEKLIDLKTDCSELESRVYRWLSFSYPIYERWNGQQLTKPPNMKDYVKDPSVFQPSDPASYKTFSSPKTSRASTCFLNKFKSQLNGKGIVMSIGEHHVEDTIKLVKLLRVLNNQYPIQIAYYDNLSKELKERIVKAARIDAIELPESFDRVKGEFPHLEGKKPTFPKQEVWFVNTYNAIQPNYRNKFDHFANKYFATIFNSFTEFMIIDADVALLKKPEYFFNMAKYVEKGAYFFRDRSINDLRPQSDLVFFQKLMPSLLDSTIFDIPVVTEKTLNLDFMQGAYHYVESGVVVLNRMKHFNSILTMVQLNFFHAMTERVHGDKEVFWLAFSTNGDENVEFNKYAAASIGQVTPQNERLSEDGKELKSREICGNHPGHVSGEDDRTLLWLNSGFEFCPKDVNFSDEVGRGKIFKSFGPGDEEKLEKMYKSRVHITHAVVPPYNPQELKNDDQEPPIGWYYPGIYCGYYTWCGYSSIGGNIDGKDNTMYGTFIEYSEEETAVHDFLGDVWMSV